jgi:hypothetical protein
MKKATLIIWAIIFGFIALVIFQNQEFFLNKQSLRIYLGVVDEYLTPNLPIAVMVLFFFFCGIVIAYFFSVSARFKAKRTIKKLNATIASHKKEVSELKNEISLLKGPEPSVEDQTKETKVNLDATQKITNENIDESPAGKTPVLLANNPTSNPTEKMEDKSNKKNQ